MSSRVRTLGARGIHAREAPHPLPPYLPLPDLPAQTPLPEHWNAGTLPTQLGLLPLDQDFRLDHNRFTGPIPSELLQLTSLTTDFTLAHNSLSGSIPSQLFANLAQLDLNVRLNDNLLTGPLPTDVGRLTGLRGTLSLASNALTGPLPSQVRVLPAYLLQSAATCCCNASATSPRQLGMISLLRANLHLESNRFTSTIPSELGQATRVTTSWHLQANSLSGTIPSQVHPSPSLSAAQSLSCSRLSGNSWGE